MSRCLGSDDYRYEGGRVCGNQPVRADYLDQVVRDHITGLLADPALIRAEISKRLDAARTSDPVTSQRTRLQAALAKATASVTAMIEAFAEQLITIDELRARMPHLRAREANLRAQIDALDAQAADRDACLKLADDLEGFLAQLRGNAATATVEDRQRVLRLLVKDILIGPEKITIRHRIPTRPGGSGARQRDPEPDTEGDRRPSYLLRWGRDDPATGKRRDLGKEEEHAFWAFAAVEVFRATGVRIEELLEISHHSLVQYRLPDTGEIVPLLQIAPSKTDAERLLLVSPELADVLATIIHRVRGQAGAVSLIPGYDSHERLWSPPAPLLFQRRVGSERRAINASAIRGMLTAALACTSLTDLATGAPLHFTPHDFRRLLSA
ncbi:MAG: hypothetical protein ACLP52_11270 [Streptosporangiaceae bacterium]